MSVHQEIINESLNEAKKLETWKRVDETEETSANYCVTQPFFDPGVVGTWTTSTHITIPTKPVPLAELKVYAAKNGYVVEINSDTYVATDVQELQKVLNLVKKYVEPKGK